MKVISLVPDPGADKPALRDIPEMLRRLAERIEKGEEWPIGDVVRAAVVLRVNGEQPILLGFGDTNPVQTFEDLHAGAAELLHMNNPSR